MTDYLWTYLKTVLPTLILLKKFGKRNCHSDKAESKQINFSAIGINK